MSFTNSAVTKYMDEYFEERPQLTPPPSTMLGYEVDSGVNHVLNSMMSKVRAARLATPSVSEHVVEKIARGVIDFQTKCVECKGALMLKSDVVRVIRTTLRQQGVLREQSTDNHPTCVKCKQKFVDRCNTGDDTCTACELSAELTTDKERDIKEPEGCMKEYGDVCDGCRFNEFEMVPHPGGESTVSVEKHHCELGHWQDDF